MIELVMVLCINKECITFKKEFDALDNCLDYIERVEKTAEKTPTNVKEASCERSV